MAGLFTEPELTAMDTLAGKLKEMAAEMVTVLNAKAAVTSNTRLPAFQSAKRCIDCLKEAVMQIESAAMSNEEDFNQR